MLRFLIRRLALAAVAVVGIVIVVFCVVRVLPGDAAVAQAGPVATEERIAEIRSRMGLDDPLPAQFASYVGDLAQGDLGESVRTHAPVARELADRLPASLELSLYALLFATVVGVALGVLGAARGGAVGEAVRFAAIIGSAVPLFWLGLVLLYVFFFLLGWFPGPVGRLPAEAEPPPAITGFYTIDAVFAGDLAAAWSAARQLVLPVLTLGLVLSAPILKMVRSSMIATLQTDYVRTARSLGVPAFEVLMRDGLRNALMPIITSIGLVFGYLLGGNVIVETLFAWPGVGRYAYDAIQGSDLQALQGFTILVGLLYVGLNIVIDLAYAAIDPRIRLGGRASA